MRILNLKDAKEYISRSGLEDEKLKEYVKDIVLDVKENGDKALFSYCEKFDGSLLNSENISISQKEIDEAYSKVDEKFLKSLRLAIKNVLEYHSRNIMKEDIRTKDGRTTGYTVRPVDRAGIYAPGGTAPLCSSVLMGVLPAKAAGVKEIYLATPAKNGVVNPAVIVAGVECGATKIYKIGGAQAISAFAYGTESVKKVDVIAGPGNVFVTLAKKEVYGKVGIDMLAGPSEILIIADKSSNPEFVGADVLSQAEHDKLARALVLTDDKNLAEKISSEVERQVELLPRKEIAKTSLQNNGAIILIKDMAEAVEIANDIAPEHLEIYTENPEELLKGINNAGAVFLGGYTPEPLGDYFAGPDHILPTSGTAKFFEVLNQDIFLRKMSVIKYDKKAIDEDGKHVVCLAESEALQAHANAVKVRLK